MFQKNEKKHTMDYVGTNHSIPNVCRQFEVRKIVTSIEQNQRKRLAFG